MTEAGTAKAVLAAPFQSSGEKKPAIAGITAPIKNNLRCPGCPKASLTA